MKNNDIYYAKRKWKHSSHWWILIAKWKTKSTWPPISFSNRFQSMSTNWKNSYKLIILDSFLQLFNTPYFFLSFIHHSHTNYLAWFHPSFFFFLYDLYIDRFHFRFSIENGLLCSKSNSIISCKYMHMGFTNFHTISCSASPSTRR